MSKSVAENHLLGDENPSSSKPLSVRLAPPKKDHVVWDNLVRQLGLRTQNGAALDRTN